MHNYGMYAMMELVSSVVDWSSCGMNETWNIDWSLWWLIGLVME